MSVSLSPSSRAASAMAGPSIVLASTVAAGQVVPLPGGLGGVEQVGMRRPGAKIDQQQVLAVDPHAGGDDQQQRAVRVLVVFMMPPRGWYGMGCPAGGETGRRWCGAAGATAPAGAGRPRS